MPVPTTSGCCEKPDRNSDSQWVATHTLRITDLVVEVRREDGLLSCLWPALDRLLEQTPEQLPSWLAERSLSHFCTWLPFQSHKKCFLGSLLAQFPSSYRMAGHMCVCSCLAAKRTALNARLPVLQRNSLSAGTTVSKQEAHNLAMVRHMCRELFWYYQSFQINGSPKSGPADGYREPPMEQLSRCMHCEKCALSRRPSKLLSAAAEPQSGFITRATPLGHLITRR
ncbi:hypothetical protein T10_3654 [Trichinella papuae]|uniref:Uncharacterized protein n=1 Tax=Trichinella papuae TaxID=268474 RepID=A0A0V1M0R6_9BILA|nr:hypothetical protein T10_3654 [Trichinella papuae]